ncbi:MAG: T9SS type A sorting domain-containing protein [Ignavibacteriales bacterium]|nr:T9SS type A sorting domain-containing protein [Ignavibacteriales bacterium]
MKIKIVLTVILLSTIIAAQNTYEVKPGVKNNQIVLQLSNVSSTESASNLEVKLIKNSKFLNFNQTEKTIENITQGTETEAIFNFDVNYNIGKAKADTIEFMISDNKSVYLTKQFVLNYGVPTEYKLEQNFPNPFNPTTKIRYSIPSNVNREMSNVVLKVYDILGNEVNTFVNEQKEPGYYEVDFNASQFASGVYIYRLISGNFISTKKMMVLK